MVLPLAGFIVGLPSTGFAAGAGAGLAGAGAAGFAAGAAGVVAFAAGAATGA